LRKRTNRDLSRFLLSIKYDDTSQAFTSEGLGTSFSELKDAFSEVCINFRRYDLQARFTQGIFRQ
jgi:hypothetical protein